MLAQLMAIRWDQNSTTAENLLKLSNK
jgi:hypothetical protein